MKLQKRERVILRLDAEEQSLDGQLLSYLKDDPALSLREATLRALKAFYLPWVLEGQQTEVEMRAIAKTTIEELQYRAFQIRQRFLPEETSQPLLGELPGSEVAALPAPVRSQSVVDPPIAVTVEQMHQEVDSEKLSQILDDY